MPRESVRPHLNAELLASSIVEARERDQLSLREAAEMCGVAFSTLSRLERAQGGKPDLDTLERIAAWLKVPAAVFFFRPQPVEAHLRARKQLESGTATALRDLIVAARAMYGTATSDHEIAERDPDDGPIPRDQWEAVATSIRRDIGLKPDERLNPFDLKLRGVDVVLASQVRGVSEETLAYLLDAGSAHWSAATIPIHSARIDWLIVVNSAHTVERQRASLMEEYCHVLLGHEMTQLSHQEGVTFRDYQDAQEQEAYYIGAAILVPEETLRTRLARHDSADKIAKHFGVSKELVEYRIKRLGLWYLYRLQKLS